jgi:hypothetical protein
VTPGCSWLEQWGVNRRAVAHHEAGHALLMTLAGYRLRYVTARARGAEGRTVYPRRSVTREQKAREAAAGPIAEAELLARLDPVTPWGEHLDAVLADRGRHDELLCAELVRDPDCEELAALASLVRRHWPGVQRLAAELVRSGTVDGRTAAALLLDIEPQHVAHVRAQLAQLQLQAERLAVTETSTPWDNHVAAALASADNRELLAAVLLHDRARAARTPPTPHPRRKTSDRAAAHLGCTSDFGK